MQNLQNELSALAGQNCDYLFPHNGYCKMIQVCQKPSCMVVPTLEPGMASSRVTMYWDSQYVSRMTRSWCRAGVLIISIPVLVTGAM